jgi:hypothetical protein
LDNFRPLTGFSKIKHVVIVADDDRLADNRFAQVVNQVREIAATSSPRFAIPAQERVRATLNIANTSTVDVTVAMIPWTGTPGVLETLLLPAARAASAVVAQGLDAFVQHCGVNAWALEASRNKMKLRCLLAAAHEDNPGIGVGKVWSDAEHLIPIDHPSLKQMVDFISSQTA